jgi:hypothetical protein
MKLIGKISKMKKRKIHELELPSSKRARKSDLVIFLARLIARYRGHLERCKHARKIFHFYS